MISALMIGVGLFFAIHCSLASRREFRSSRVLGGKWGSYDRESAPVGFWFIMGCNVAAAVLGVVFLIFGAVEMLVFFGVVK